MKEQWNYPDVLLCTDSKPVFSPTSTQTTTKSADKACDSSQISPFSVDWTFVPVNIHVGGMPLDWWSVSCFAWQLDFLHSCMKLQ